MKTNKTKEPKKCERCGRSLNCVPPSVYGCRVGEGCAKNGYWIKGN